MDNWSEVMVFLAGKISEAEALTAYYRSEAERLEAENRSLRQHVEMMEVNRHAENALETAR